MFTKLPPIKDRKIRFALVGCGRISKNHFSALKAHENFCDLIAICDSDPERLKLAAQNTRVKPFSSYTQLLQEAGADIVVLATPSGFHPEQAILAAAHKKHVMTEKPMATRWKDGLKMVQACDEAGVHLFVVKQNRHNPTIQLLKRAIEKKRFGRIFMVTINVFWQRPDSYYNSSSWRGTWEFDGGALMNQASHYVDLLDWLIGPIESVHAITGTLARNIQVEDTCVLAVKWRSGALGSVNVTMLTHNKNFEGSITVIGEKGTVRLGGVAVNEFQHWEFADKDEDDEKVRNSSYKTESVYGFGHHLYYDNVIKVLCGEATPLTDGREGLKALEVLIASYTSARDGKRISLPLEY